MSQQELPGVWQHFVSRHCAINPRELQILPRHLSGIGVQHPQKTVTINAPYGPNLIIGANTAAAMTSTQQGSCCQICVRPLAIRQECCGLLEPYGVFGQRAGGMMLVWNDHCFPKLSTSALGFSRAEL